MTNFYSESKNELTISLQDYLEAIGLLIKKDKVARVKDIAEKLNVKLASVTGALKQLKKKGYIEYSPYSSITLTEKGEKLADSLITTHNLLKKLFTEIFLLNNSEANEISCIIEHYISEDSIERIKKFIEYSNNCPLLCKAIKKFPEYLKNNKINCENCNKI